MARVRRGHISGIVTATKRDRMNRPTTKRAGAESARTHELCGVMHMEPDVRLSWRSADEGTE